MSEDQWKFRAHIGFEKNRGIRMEVKQYNGIEMFREIGQGKPIYYVKSSKKNYSSEEELIEVLNKTLKP